MIPGLVWLLLLVAPVCVKRRLDAVWSLFCPFLLFSPLVTSHLFITNIVHRSMCDPDALLRICVVKIGLGLGQ